MYPAKFDYYRAGSVGEAIALLGQTPDAKIIAGGHSLLPLMKLRLATPAALIDIGRIEELKGISEQNGGVLIGALATHDRLAHAEAGEPEATGRERVRLHHPGVPLGEDEQDRLGVALVDDRFAVLVAVERGESLDVGALRRGEAVEEGVGDHSGRR